MDALFEIRKVPKRGKWHYRYNSGYRDYHYYGEEITSEILKGNKTICKKSSKNSKSNNKINSNGKGMEEYNKWVLYVIESNPCITKMKLKDFKNYVIDLCESKCDVKSMNMLKDKTPQQWSSMRENSLLTHPDFEGKIFLDNHKMKNISLSIVGGNNNFD